MEALGPGKTRPTPRRSEPRAGGVCGGGALHWGPRLNRGLHGAHTETRDVVPGSVGGSRGVYFHLTGWVWGVVCVSAGIVCVGGDLTGTFLPASFLLHAVFTPLFILTRTFTLVLLLSKCRRNRPENTDVPLTGGQPGWIGRSRRWAEKHKMKAALKNTTRFGVKPSQRAGFGLVIFGFSAGLSSVHALPLEPQPRAQQRWMDDAY